MIGSTKSRVDEEHGTRNPSHSATLGEWLHHHSATHPLRYNPPPRPHPSNPKPIGTSQSSHFATQPLYFESGWAAAPATPEWLSGSVAAPKKSTNMRSVIRAKSKYDLIDRKSLFLRKSHVNGHFFIAMSNTHMVIWQYQTNWPTWCDQNGTPLLSETQPG